MLCEETGALRDGFVRRLHAWVRGAEPDGRGGGGGVEADASRVSLASLDDDDEDAAAAAARETECLEGGGGSFAAAAFTTECDTKRQKTRKASSLFDVSLQSNHSDLVILPTKHKEPY